MSKEFGIDIIEAPEFEQRCNAFIEEVALTVITKYPGLHIRATNSTLEDIEGQDERIRRWKRTRPHEEMEKLIRISRRMADISDRASAFFNQAAIDVFDISGRGRKELVQEAVNEIKKIALKYNPDDDEYEVADYDSPYPNVHLGYFFS